MAHSLPRPTPAALSSYPVPIELITSLYRATDVQFDALVARMPENGRARSRPTARSATGWPSWA